MRNPPRSIIVYLLTLIAGASVMLGCKGSPQPKVPKNVREKAVSTLDEMYANYLSGNRADARANLLKAIAFIQSNSAAIPELEGALPISYARMSLLEREAGNEALSKLYFEKSRYWRIVEQEKLRVTPEEMLSNHESFTRNDSDRYALEWDRKWTKGFGPAYLKALDK